MLLIQVSLLGQREGWNMRKESKGTNGKYPTLQALLNKISEISPIKHL